MAVITRWSYKRGGRKAGFHCILSKKHIKLYHSKKLTFDFSSSSNIVSLGLSGGGSYQQKSYVYYYIIITDHGVFLNLH